MSRRAGFAMLPLGLAVSLSLFGDLSLFAGLSPQAGRLGLTLAQVGILLSVHRVIRIPGNPIVGLLVDRYGRRRLFLLGMLLAVLSSAGYALAYGFWPFLLTRLGWGSAWALINVSGMTMVLDASTPAGRGRLTGSYNAYLSLGYLAGPLVGGVLIDQIGFRSAMAICAGISAVGLLEALLFLPETAPEPVKPTGAPAAGFSLLTPLRLLWQGLRETLLSSRAAAAGLLLYALIIFAGDGIILSTTALLLQERIPGGLFGLGIASAAGGVIAARSLLVIVSSPLAGHLSDRLEHGRVPVIAGGLALGALSFLLMGLGRSVPVILLGVALGAFSSAAAMAGLTAFMGDLFASGARGASMGAFITAGDIGSSIGPALAFALTPLGGLAPVYVVSAGLFLAGLGLVRAMRR